MSNNNVPRWTPTQYKGSTDSYQPSTTNQYQPQNQYQQNSQARGTGQYQQQHVYASRDHNKAMFHSTISPTAANESYNTNFIGRNASETVGTNQLVYGNTQDSTSTARYHSSFSKDAGETKNQNNFDKLGTAKEATSEKVIGEGVAGQTAAEKRKREIMEIKNKLDEINKKMGKKDLNFNPSADIHSVADKPRAKIAQSCIFQTQKSPSNFTGGSMLDQLYTQKKSNAFGATGTTPKSGANEQSSPFTNITSGQKKAETSATISGSNYAFQNITTLNSGKNIKEQPKQEPKKTFVPSQDKPKSTIEEKYTIKTEEEKKTSYGIQQKTQPESYASKYPPSSTYSATNTNYGSSYTNSNSNTKTYGASNTTNIASNYGASNTTTNYSATNYGASNTSSANYNTSNTANYDNFKKTSYGSNIATDGCSSNPSSSSSSSKGIYGTAAGTAGYGSSASTNQTPTATFSKKQNTFQVSESISQPEQKQQQQSSFKKNKVAQIEAPIFKKTIEREETIPTETQFREFKKEDFHIGKKMGKGQFGEVLLVQHKLTGFLCGMKVMEKKQIRDENYVGQIARELSIQFYLSHRNIAPLYGYFSDKDNVYLLVQFCTDGQLLQRLRTERRMQENDVAVIMRQVCEGLEYIHREQILHRDIKPENILFNHGVVKISDFGWAVYRGFGMRKTASGSPLYYPPEIVKGQEYDDKIDVWTIGMMTYECILGKIPFRIYTQMDLDRIVSDQITFPEWVDVTDTAKDFILKTMCKKGQERMEIKQVLRHPFLSKAVDIHLDAKILEDFRRVLN